MVLKLPFTSAALTNGLTRYKGGGPAACCGDGDCGGSGGTGWLGSEKNVDEDGVDVGVTRLTGRGFRVIERLFDVVRRCKIRDDESWNLTQSS
jgi:hypothetical protein